jgi:hypothetical protein
MKLGKNLVIIVELERGRPGRGERRERALRGPASSAGRRQDLDGLPERRERKREKGWWEGIGGDAWPLR